LRAGAARRVQKKDAVLAHPLKRGRVDETIKKAAVEFGKALASAPAVSEFSNAAADSAADKETLHVKAELAAVYDDLIRRQAAGEMISKGEIDAYFQMEQSARANPLLARHEANLEQVKDFFSAAHDLLSGYLGMNFKDLAE